MTDVAPYKRLEAAFERIGRTRMAGMPLSNPALHVQVVGMRRWQDQWLGVLITPWAVNLVMVPVDGAALAHPQGVGRTVAFSSGEYEFFGGHEPEVGHYLTCSLFSPAFELQDQAAAVAVAEAVLAALDQPDDGAVQREAARLGGASLADAGVSRRGFLRGLLGGNG